jgi:6,7-dimethyl-8-ribityllumazine synthase
VKTGSPQSHRDTEEVLIKWVQVGALAKSSQDFALLVELLELLGLRKGPQNENRNGLFAEFMPARLHFDVIYRKKPSDDSDICLTVTDPDSAAKLVQEHGLKIEQDSSGPEPEHSVRSFRINLPGGTRVMVLGSRVVDNTIDTNHLAVEGKLSGAGKRFGVVTSRFNSFITERLLAGALDGLTRCGAKLSDSIDIIRVPGAFEIPSAARTLAETKKYDAIICLGCLLRGDTAHYDVIVNEVTRGIGQSAQETGVPHAFGVLTCDTLEQAIDRAGLKMGNKGFEAALAAVEMANLKSAISHQPSAVRKAGLRSQVSDVRKTRTVASAKKRKSRR